MFEQLKKEIPQIVDQGHSGSQNGKGNVNFNLQTINELDRFHRFLSKSK